jgi:hypothetical protein
MWALIAVVIIYLTIDDKTPSASISPAVIVFIPSSMEEVITRNYLHLLLTAEHRIRLAIIDDQPLSEDVL